ncbi:hypothetical protein QNI19_17635 [Cytophagaceae bacterium DM2B3-1]|uniref:Uncharacterized protein n=1 Tax=Xanthocytophaga flava TaxID=3048013 RepID=A0ABT7CP37_9BACT|nr:hypothetical protein [Xanthocytophaga flavus]MDJ1494765.1 hypothetical protein [Xanthocytophaga flavus]
MKQIVCGIYVSIRPSTDSRPDGYIGITAASELIKVSWLSSHKANTLPVPSKDGLARMNMIYLK